MPSQAEREAKFIWRPNTNDSTNLARYDQEAQLWTNAFHNAQNKHRKTSITSDLKVIGIVFSLVFSLITLVVILVIDFIKWLRSLT